MDMTAAAEPQADQLTFDDFAGGERTFTIAEVRKSSSPEHKVDVILYEIERPWRPPKTMVRVLIKAWGKESDAYCGRRVTLFGDPKVIWAGKESGGVRIRALSGIDKQLKVKLKVSHGKLIDYTVDPLPAEAPVNGPLTVQDYMHDLDLDADAMKALSARVLGHEISGWNDLKPEEQQLIMSALADWMDTGVDPTIEQEEA